MNEQIRLSPVLLIDEDNNRIGEVPTNEALAMAREKGLDLVEIAPEARPIVCKIMDYGKYKYEQSKKEKANKQKSKQSELKEVRLGRSMKIDPHDVAIRMKKAREFLMEGHKVQIVQNFRGREMMHKDRGAERLRGIIEQLSDISRVEVPPRQAGRRMTMILAPDKAKIEQIKRREANAADADKKPAETEPEPEDRDAEREEAPEVETEVKEEETVRSES